MNLNGLNHSTFEASGGSERKAAKKIIARGMTGSGTKPVSETGN